MDSQHNIGRDQGYTFLKNFMSENTCSPAFFMTGFFKYRKYKPFLFITELLSRSLKITLAIITLVLSTKLYAICPAPNINNAPAETIQAAYHATMHYTIDALAVAGATSGPGGFPGNNSNDNSLLTEVIPANGYNYTGIIQFGTLGSFGFSNNTQYIILTDDNKLWAWGDESEVLHGSLTTGRAFQQLTLGLPSGVTAADVAEFKAAWGTLVIRTNAGAVWMTGHDNGLFNGGSTTAWNQITTNGTTPLTNIVKIDIANEVAFAVDSSGDLYTWGEDTFLGDGSLALFNRQFPTLMVNPPLPAGVTVIQAEISRDRDINASYYILGSDLKLYALGQNNLGQIGIGNTTNQIRSWVNVRNSTNSADLTNVVFFSATDNSIQRSGVSAILSNGTLLSWGDNSSNMIGATGSPVLLPTVPNGFTLGTDVALFVENGGHLTPYVNNQGNVCNVGHNLEGGFGDGTTANRSTYACPPVPAIAGDLCLAVLKDFGDNPDTYNTKFSSNGPFHLINEDLYVGTTPPLANFDGAPSASAADDFDEVDTFFSQQYNPAGGMTCSGSNGTYTTAANEYCVVISATNNTQSDAQLVAWLDYDISGVFDNAERSQTMPANAHPDDDGTFMSGNVAANSGTNNYVLVFTGLGVLDAQSASATYARVRITNDKPEFFSDTSPLPGGEGGTGEVHDELIAFDILPVTLSAVSSKRSGDKLKVDWSTSSELFNVGYQLWGLDGTDSKWEKLHGWLQRSGSGNAVEPQSYSKTVNIPKSVKELVALGISSIDNDGSEHYYGPFDVGQAYGNLSSLKPIAWDHVRKQVDAQMAARSYVRDRLGGYRKVDINNASTSSATASSTDTQSVVEFRVRDAGIYRLKAQDLLTAGMDWRDIEKRDIALIDHRGKAVVRYVATTGSGAGQAKTLGANGEIYFYAEGPDNVSGLYGDTNVYRLVINRHLALNAQFQRKRGINGGYSTHYQAIRELERDNQYSLNSAADDPWLDTVVLSHGDQTASYAAAIAVDADALWDHDAVLTLGLARSSSLAPVDADGDGHQDVEHTVEAVVLSPDGVGGLVPLGTDEAVGTGMWTPEFTIPGGTALTLIDGKAVVGGLFRAGAGYGFSEVQVDSVRLAYARPYEARVDEVYLMFTAPDDGALGYEVTVPETGWPLVFAHSNGNLVRLGLESQVKQTASGGKKQRVVRFAALAGTASSTTAVNYWVSGKGGLLGVEALSTKTIASTSSLLAQAAGTDLLMVAHPAFMTQSLSDYAQFKRSQGLTVTIINYLDIVDAFGGGQPGPTGLTRYLGEVSAQGTLEHVLLVGGSSYDHTDKLGAGAMTFIPGHYGNSRYSNYTVTDTPYISDTDNRLFASIGRWPVRTSDDLDTIIAGSMAWSTSDHAQGSALAIAEHTVEGEGIDFWAALDGVVSQLPSAWTTNKVHVDEIRANNPNLSLPQALAQAKKQIISGLNESPDIVLYNGHATTSQLSNKGLFKAGDVGLASSRGGQLWLPMSCYMTYYESTHVNTLAHQLLFSGNAVGITGSMLLSDQSENISAGTSVLSSTVDQGLSIGAAVRAHKRAQSNPKLNINLSHLGDPTLRM